LILGGFVGGAARLDVVENASRDARRASGLGVIVVLCLKFGAILSSTEY
jgi:hypothetical protein